MNYQDQLNEQMRQQEEFQRRIKQEEEVRQRHWNEEQDRQRRLQHDEAQRRWWEDQQRQADAQQAQQQANEQRRRNEEYERQWQQQQARQNTYHTGSQPRTQPQVNQRQPRNQGANYDYVAKKSGLSKSAVFIFFAFLGVMLFGFAGLRPDEGLPDRQPPPRPVGSTPERINNLSEPISEAELDGKTVRELQAMVNATYKAAGLRASATEAEVDEKFTLVQRANIKIIAVKVKEMKRKK